VLQTEAITEKVEAAVQMRTRETVEARARNFADLTGKDAPTAPKVDEPKPKGSISMDHLSFPRRL
jgi:hypothetical protein